MRTLSAALLLVAAAAAAPAIAVAPAHAQQLDEIFVDAAATEFSAQVAGTYPARNEVLVKVANGNQFALPVAAGTDLSVWRTNEVLDVVVTQGAVTELAPAAAATPEATFSVLTEDVPGAPEDAVVRTVTASFPAESVTVSETTVSFVGPEGVARTALIAEGVTIAPITGEWVTITYFDAIDISRR